MPFRKILKNLVESMPGAIGAVFADYEGETVDFYSSNDEPYQLKVIGAHNCAILNLINKAQKKVRGGDVSTVTLKMDNFSIIITPVKQGYYLLVTLKNSSMMEKACYRIKKAVKALIDEMGLD